MEEQEIEKSHNRTNSSSIKPMQRKSSLSEEDRKSLSERILNGKAMAIPIKSILRKHKNTREERHSALSLTSKLSRSVTFARNKLDLERVKVYVPDSAQALVPSSNHTAQAQNTLIDEEVDIDDQSHIKHLSSSLFLAAKRDGGLNDMIKILRNGASARGFQDEKPLEEVKRQLFLIDEELKAELNPEKVALLKRRKGEFKLKSVALKIFKEAELSVDLARNVRGLKTFEFSPIVADDLYRTDTPEDSAHFVYAQIFMDDFLIEPHMPMIPFSSKINWKDMGGNVPKYYATFDIETDARYRPERNIRIDLMKGRPLAANEVKLGSWEKTVLDVVKILQKNSSNSETVTSELKCTDYLMEGAYMDVEFKKVKRDGTIFRRKRNEYARKIGGILEWIKLFQKDTQNAGKKPLIDADIYYFGNISLLHAAVYLYDSNLVRAVLHAGADVSRKGKGIGSAIDLSGNLFEESKRTKDGLDEEYRIITGILKKAKAQAILQREDKLKKSSITDEKDTHDSCHSEPIGNSTKSDMITKNVKSPQQRPSNGNVHMEKNRNLSNICPEDNYRNEPEIPRGSEADNTGTGGTTKSQSFRSSGATPNRKSNQAIEKGSYSSSNYQYNNEHSTITLERRMDSMKNIQRPFPSNKWDDKALEQGDGPFHRAADYQRGHNSRPYPPQGIRNSDFSNSDNGLQFSRNNRSRFGAEGAFNHARPWDQIHNESSGPEWRNNHFGHSERWQGPNERFFQDGLNKQPSVSQRGPSQQMRSNSSFSSLEKSPREGKDIKDVTPRRVSTIAPPTLEDYSSFSTPFFPIKHPEMNVMNIRLSTLNTLLVDQVRFVIMPEERGVSPRGYRRVGIACSHCKHGCKIDDIDNWYKTLQTIDAHLASNCFKIPTHLKTKLISIQDRDNIPGTMGMKRFCSFCSKHYKLYKPANEGRGDPLCIKFGSEDDKKKDSEVASKSKVVKRTLSHTSQPLVKALNPTATKQSGDRSLEESATFDLNEVTKKNAETKELKRSPSRETGKEKSNPDERIKVMKRKTNKEMKKDQAKRILSSSSTFPSSQRTEKKHTQPKGSRKDSNAPSETSQGVESSHHVTTSKRRIPIKSKMSAEDFAARKRSGMAHTMTAQIIALSDSESSSNSSNDFKRTTKGGSRTVKRKRQSLPESDSSSDSSNDPIVTELSLKKKKKSNPKIAKKNNTSSFVNLPRLEEGILWPRDLMGKHLKRCEDFDLNQCKRGSRCRKVHVYPSLGNRLNKVDQNPDWYKHPLLNVPPSSVMIEEVEEKGKMWYTAAYEDPVTRIIYHAEHSKKEHQCQGICWFLSDHEAYSSLRKVIYLALSK